MNCPNCGAPMRLEEGRECWTCTYCTSLYFPEKNEDGVRVLGEASQIRCPICAIPLVHAAIDRHRILYCARCHGSLIAMPTFVFLAQDLRAQQGATEVAPPPNPAELKRRIQCPKCSRPMETHFYGGPGNIVIDDCSACELNWLDYGELMRVARAADSSYRDRHNEPDCTATDSSTSPNGE